MGFYTPLPRTIHWNKRCQSILLSLWRYLLILLWNNWPIVGYTNYWTVSIHKVINYLKPMDWTILLVNHWSSVPKTRSKRYDLISSNTTKPCCCLCSIIKQNSHLIPLIEAEKVGLFWKLSVVPRAILSIHTWRIGYTLIINLNKQHHFNILINIKFSFILTIVIFLFYN